MCAVSIMEQGSKIAHAEQDLDSIEKDSYEAPAGVAGCIAANTPAMSAVQRPCLPLKKDCPEPVQLETSAISRGLLESHYPSAEDSGTAVLLKAHEAQLGDVAKPVSMQEDDMEKGLSIPDHADEPVDFLGGFSLNSCFDPHMDVVLRFEFETSGQLKMRAVFVLAALAVSVAGFIVLLLIKCFVSNSSLFRSKVLEVINVIASSILLVITVITMVAFTRRWFNCLRKGMRWSLRRKMMSRIYWIMGLVMVFQLALWLAPNAWAITRSYTWFGRFVAICGILRWSLTNLLMVLFVVNGHNTNPWSSGEGSLLGGCSANIVLDAPQWRTHWPKAVLWVIFEVPYILQLVEVFSPHYHDLELAVKPLRSGGCHRVTHFTAVATYSGGVFILVYLVMYLWYLHKGFLLLRSLPYNTFRVGNILVRVQAARTILAFSVAILSCVVLWYSNPYRCASFFFAWQGLFPMEVVLAALVIANCTSFMPRNPNKKDDPILQVWLQQFAWTEAEKPGKLADRCEHVTNPASAASLDEEPMFCVETALKALYWSTLVYRYDENAPDFTRDKPLKGRHTPEQGMRMLGLEQVQLFWERSLDTKVLIGWSASTIVISIRGTASLRNAIADIQAWRVAHPPKRGRWWMASRPLVHRGFYMTWAANGLNRRVIAHVNSIIEASPMKAANMRILVTGHSLGGVVAILAAHDLATQLGLRNTQVYTFGAPRPGNRAFKEEYDQLIPDTWNVINDAVSIFLRHFGYLGFVRHSLDAVPRVGKFFILFSRPGKRVIIDYRGDVVVRPSPYEIFIRSGSNPGHHFLASYRRAFMGICQAQFTSKAQPGGRASILELIQQSEMREFLSVCGLSPDSLERMAFAATVQARSQVEGKAQKPVSQRDSVWLDRLDSIHRAPLAFRHMFSAGRRRVGDRRSTETATLPAAAPESATASGTTSDMTQGVPIASGEPLLTGAPLQRAEKSAMSTLVEGLSALGQAEGEGEGEAADTQTEASLAEAPSLSRIRVAGGITPLTSSPTRRPATEQGSMSPLMLSPQRTGMSAPPVAHDSVQIGRPGSADALREVHAEIMDKGVQLPPTGSRRGSLSRHRSEMASRRTIGASPSKRMPTGAAEERPLTLAQTWARITRPPLAGRAASACGTPRSSAVTSPLGRPSAQPGQPGPPRAPLQAWSSLPSLAQQPPPASQKSLQLQSPTFLPGKQITPASPEWVPSPFSGSGFAGELYDPLARPPMRPAADNSTPISTPQASHRSEALESTSAAALGSAPSAAGPRGIVRHKSARAELLQRAAHTLSRRTANPEDLQSILQGLQKRSWQPDRADSRPSTSASLAEEGRACRHLSAQVENAVLPQLGSMVARATRLFSQASVALGIRVDPDVEMAEPLGDVDREDAVAGAEMYNSHAELTSQQINIDGGCRTDG